MSGRSTGLRALRYEGTKKPYFFLCVPDTEGAEVCALMTLLHDYGYRFFVPLPGDEDLGGDTGFFFKDERMEQAHRMIVVLPASGADQLRAYEEQGLQEWLNHHAATDVLVVHLGAGEAGGALADLLAGCTHLRPSEAGGEDFLQRLLDQLLPQEYDPRRDRSLRPEGEADAVVAGWRARAMGRGKRVLWAAGMVLLALPYVVSVAIAPPWQSVSSYLGCAADVLLVTYALLLAVTLMVCDGFPQWTQPWMKELRQVCPGWYAGLNPVARVLRAAACGLFWLTLTARLMLGTEGALLDRLSEALWRSVSGLGLWTIMESALSVVVEGRLLTPRKERRTEAAVLGSVMFVLLMAGRLIFAVPDTPANMLIPLLTGVVTLVGLTAISGVSSAWSKLMRWGRV